jgi:hypothetical protein
LFVLIDRGRVFALTPRTGAARFAPVRDILAVFEITAIPVSQGLVSLISIRRLRR